MTTTLKTIKFPFQRDATSFPAMVEDADAVMTQVRSLVETGRGEQPMKPQLGLSAYQLVFDNVTPIMRARLATDVAQQIRDKVPRAQLQGVDVYEVEAQDGTVTVYVEIIFSVAGVTQTVQVPVGSGG